MTIRKVLHIRSTNFIGGPEKQVIYHARKVDQSLWSIIICSYLEKDGKNDFIEFAKSEGIRTVSIKTKDSYNPLILLEILKILKTLQPDLIVVHDYKPLAHIFLLRILINIPVIAVSRGFTYEDRKVTLYESLQRFLFRFADRIIAVSYGQRELLVKYNLPPKSIDVVHNSISIDSCRPGLSYQEIEKVKDGLRVPANCMMVVAAGRLSPEKGHRFLVDAIDRLSIASINVCFVFCGEGRCRTELENQAKFLGVSEMCRFVGFRQDIMEIFKAMDLLVLPSLTEGLPNVVLEAFAAKKPVVATSVGGVPELVENGVNGLLVPPKRPDLLARAIEKCLSSPESLRIMGEAGYEKVKSQFAFESQARELEKIYLDTLERRAC